MGNLTVRTSPTIRRGPHGGCASVSPTTQFAYVVPWEEKGRSAPDRCFDKVEDLSGQARPIESLRLLKHSERELCLQTGVDALLGQRSRRRCGTH